MSEKSEWKKRAEPMLQTQHPKQVIDSLYPISNYKSKRSFASKVYDLAALLKKRGTFIKLANVNEKLIAEVTGEYKEVRLFDGTTTITDTVDRKLTDDELYERYGRNKEDWRISMVWFKDKQSGFLLSCCFIPLKKTPENTLKLTDEFIKRLNKIKPIMSSLFVQKLDKKLPPCIVVISKQDAHWDKKDITGENDIDARFKKFRDNLIKQLTNANSTNSIEKIVYIVGSDEFNSEWTGATTKGTIQQNILSHQESFEKITDFNIETIKLLLTFSESVVVTLLNGNHDHNSGWHLANLLKRVFSEIKQVTVDDRIDNTKVFGWADNLVLINHGDEMKPKDLAVKFPSIAKEMWSKYSNYYVITGDKHHEVAHDYNGIMTYQVPQLSKAKSSWDDKKGYIVGKAEMVNFVFEADGLSAILRNRM